jgi:hypothetical protein
VIEINPKAIIDPITTRVAGDWHDTMVTVFAGIAWTRLLLFQKSGTMPRIKKLMALTNTSIGRLKRPLRRGTYLTRRSTSQAWRKESKDPRIAGNFGDVPGLIMAQSFAASGYRVESKRESFRIERRLTDTWPMYRSATVLEANRRSMA